jgi:hypothetical protein
MAERKRTIGVRDDFCISLRRRTTDVQPMTKSHMKTPAMIYKAIHRKLKIEQQILGMFLSAIALSVLLRLTASNYLFWYLQALLESIVLIVYMYIILEIEQLPFRSI